MRKMLIIIPILAAGLTLALSAQQGELIKDFTLTGTSQEGANTVYEVRHATGFALTVSVRGEPTQEQVKMVESIARSIMGMKYLVPSTVRIALSDRRAEVIMVPKSFTYKGVDYVPYMPSGVQFFYVDSLEYDFRLMVQNLFLRVRGQYFSEEQFADKIASAVENPYSYIQTHDPEYIIKKFQEIEENIERMKAAFASTVAAGKDELSALKAELSATKSDLAAANKKAESLLSDFNLLRNAVVVLNNRGFFGSINIPSREAVAKLVEMKKREPGLTMQNAEARMQAEGVQISSKEVFLVYSVYFNEFQ